MESGRILVTGASGLLGANLVMALRERRAEVVAVYHRHRLAGDGFRAVEADLADRAVAAELVRRVRPAWVAHCAAVVNVDACEDEPEATRAANVEMPRALAEAAGEVGARLLYISTDSVFDGQRGGYTEADPPAPVNAYARSKRDGEIAVREGLPNSLIARVNLYGWNMQAKMSLGEWMLSRLEARDPFPGFDDVIFSPLLVNDLSEVLIVMMGRGLTGVYHVGSADACSKYQFGVWLAEEFGLDAGLIRRASIDEITMRAPRPKNTFLRTERVRRELGRPLPEVRDGLRRFRALRESGYVDRLKRMGEG